jgi:hypothetical protein
MANRVGIVSDNYRYRVDSAFKLDSGICVEKSYKKKTGDGDSIEPAL